MTNRSIKRVLWKQKQIWITMCLKMWFIPFLSFFFFDDQVEPSLFVFCLCFCGLAVFLSSVSMDRSKPKSFEWYLYMINIPSFVITALVFLGGFASYIENIFFS